MDALRPLSLDQFAAMTAEMEAGFPRAKVLEDASVSTEQWELTQETWLLRMAKQGQQRKLALLDRYNELLAKHRKAAQRKMRAEKRKLKGPMPVAPEAHLSPLARGRQDDGSGATFQKGPGEVGASRAPVVTPAPVMTGPAWITSAVAPAALAPTSEIDNPITNAVPDSAPPPPPVAPVGPAWLAAAGAPRADAPANTLETTQGGEPSPVAAAARAAGPAWLHSKTPARADATPLPRSDQGARSDARAGSTPPPPPPSSPSVASPWASTARPAVPINPLEGTLGGEPSPVAAAAAASGPAWLNTKPQRRDEPVPPTVAPNTAAAKPAGPAWLQSSVSFTGMPFQHGASAAATPATAAPAAQPQAQRGGLPSATGLPFQARPAQPTPQAHASPSAQPTPQASQQPQPVQPAQHAHAVQPVQPAKASPTSPPGQPSAPRLSIEQLAWLQVQMETSPEKGRVAREQLGLSEADYNAERAIWQKRFQQDRATVERYSQLFYHYRGQAR